MTARWGRARVLVLDEVSQVSTRDAETVLAAIAGCAEGELWVLGDPRQGQPVLAGGLADHLAGRVAAGEVPGGVLAENRRQVAAEDREALRLLRDGRAEGSQTIRTEHGWEHDCGSPAASRDGLTDAAVADMASKGAGNVAVLCVSHVDAEDLADRIRRRLTADGAIHGPGLDGTSQTPKPPGSAHQSTAENRRHQTLAASPQNRPST